MNIMENNEQSNQAPVVEDNGGPVRGHFESTDQFALQGLKPEITFEQALEVVKREMLSRTRAMGNGEYASIHLEATVESCNGDIFTWKAYTSSGGWSEPISGCATIEDAIRSVPNKEQARLKKAETLRAEIAAKQSELERLEGKAQ